MSNPDPNDFYPAHLSQPALRALANEKITNLLEVSRLSKSFLTGLHGMGPKGIRELEEALASKGLSFKSN